MELTTDRSDASGRGEVNECRYCHTTFGSAEQLDVHQHRFCVKNPLTARMNKAHHSNSQKSSRSRDGNMGSSRSERRVADELELLLTDSARSGRVHAHNNRNSHGEQQERGRPGSEHSGLSRKAMLDADESLLDELDAALGLPPRSDAEKKSAASRQRRSSLSNGSSSAKNEGRNVNFYSPPISVRELSSTGELGDSSDETRGKWAHLLDEDENLLDALDTELSEINKKNMIMKNKSSFESGSLQQRQRVIAGNGMQYGAAMMFPPGMQMTGGLQRPQGNDMPLQVDAKDPMQVLAAQLNHMNRNMMYGVNFNFMQNMHAQMLNIAQQNGQLQRELFDKYRQAEIRSQNLKLEMDLLKIQQKRLQDGGGRRHIHSDTGRRAQPQVPVLDFGAHDSDRNSVRSREDSRRLSVGLSGRQSSRTAQPTMPSKALLDIEARRRELEERKRELALRREDSTYRRKSRFPSGNNSAAQSRREALQQLTKRASKLTTRGSGRDMKRDTSAQNSGRTGQDVADVPVVADEKPVLKSFRADAKREQVAPQHALSVLRHHPDAWYVHAEDELAHREGEGVPASGPNGDGLYFFFDFIDGISMKENYTAVRVVYSCVFGDKAVPYCFGETTNRAAQPSMSSDEGKQCVINEKFNFHTFPEDSFNPGADLFLHMELEMVPNIMSFEASDARKVAWTKIPLYATDEGQTRVANTGRWITSWHAMPHDPKMTCEEINADVIDGLQLFFRICAADEKDADITKEVSPVLDRDSFSPLPLFVSTATDPPPPPFGRDLPLPYNSDWADITDDEIFSDSDIDSDDDETVHYPTVFCGLRVRKLHLPEAMSSKYPYVRARVTRFLCSRTVQGDATVPEWPGLSDENTTQVREIDGKFHADSISEIFWYVVPDEENNQDERLSWNLRSQRCGNGTPADCKHEGIGYKTTCWNEQRVFSFLKPSDDPPYDVAKNLDMHYAVVTIWTSSVYTRDGVKPKEGVEVPIGYAVIPMSDFRAPPAELPANPIAVREGTWRALMHTMQNDPAEAYAEAGLLLDSLDEDPKEWSEIHKEIHASARWKLAPFVGVVEVEVFSWGGPTCGEDISTMPKGSDDVFMQKEYRTFTQPPLQFDEHKLVDSDSRSLAIAVDGARYVGIEFAFVVARLEVVASDVSLCEVKHCLLDRSRISPRFDLKLILRNLAELSEPGEVQVLIHLYGYRASSTRFCCIGQSKLHVFARNVQRDPAIPGETEECFINEGHFQLPVWGQRDVRAADFSRPQPGMSVLLRMKLCSDDDQIEGFLQQGPQFYTNSDGSPQYDFDLQANGLKDANIVMFRAFRALNDATVSASLESLTNPGESKVKFVKGKMEEAHLDARKPVVLSSSSFPVMPYADLVGTRSVLVSVDRVASRNMFYEPDNPNVFMCVATLHSDVLSIMSEDAATLMVQSNTNPRTADDVKGKNSVHFVKPDWQTLNSRAQDFSDGFQGFEIDCKFENRLVLVLRVKCTRWLQDESRQFPFDLVEYGWTAIRVGCNFMDHRYVQSGHYVLPLYCGNIDDAYVNKLLFAGESETVEAPKNPLMNNAAHCFVRVCDAALGGEHANITIPRASDASVIVDHSHVPESRVDDYTFFATSEGEALNVAAEKEMVSSAFISLL